MSNKLFGVLLALSMTVILAPNANAQFENKRNYAGVHLGAGASGGAFDLGLDYERGITNIGEVGPGIIGIGGLLDYYSYSYGYYYDAFYPSETGTLTYFDLGLTGMYHFVLQDRSFDPFLGLVLGYQSVTWSAPGVAPFAAPYNSGLILGASAGLRYFFNRNWSAQARVGFGFYTFALGVDYSF